MVKRKTLLTKSQEKLEKEQLDHQLAQDKLQLQADLLETQRQLGVKKQELVNAKSASVLEAGKVLSIQDEVKALEAGEQALIDLEKELF